MASDDKFNQIYELYYKLMYKVSYSILQNFEDTEDVLQEAFIRIDKNILKFLIHLVQKQKILWLL